MEGYRVDHMMGMSHQNMERTGSWPLSGASEQERVDMPFGVQLLR